MQLSLTSAMTMAALVMTQFEFIDKVQIVQQVPTLTRGHSQRHQTRKFLHGERSHERKCTDRATIQIELVILIGRDHGTLHRACCILSTSACLFSS